tara:strand:- start:1312 stop:1590 length:279 start_codon:yes stop_codon:yes gene_type:complete
MSDSIRKYNELVEDGLIKPNDNKLGTYIYESPDGGISVRKRKFHESTTTGDVYTELELVETVANIARQYRDMPPSLILQIAKDEISVKKVCD